MRLHWLLALFSGIAFITFVAAGAGQAVAISEALMLLGCHPVPAVITAYLCAWAPGIGTALGIVAAHSAWGMPWTLSSILFGIPLLLVVMALVVNRLSGA